MGTIKKRKIFFLRQTIFPIQMFSSHHGSHSNELALEYFDFAYPLIFHRHWSSIRLALLSLPKPVALINPYSLSNKNVKEKLFEQGAVDMLRFDNEKLREQSNLIQERISKSDQEYGIKRLLEQKENRRLLGTSDLVDDQEEIDNDDEEQMDEEDDINTFNQPEPVKSLDEIYQKALEQQVKVFLFNISKSEKHCLFLSSIRFNQ